MNTKLVSMQVLGILAAALLALAVVLSDRRVFYPETKYPGDPYNLIAAASNGADCPVSSMKTREERCEYVKTHEEECEL